jgi:hypothetical protein
MRVSNHFFVCGLKTAFDAFSGAPHRLPRQRPDLRQFPWSIANTPGLFNLSENIPRSL